ncbi:MAG: hypothetical protein AB1679_19195 [Actinomycetota bacterium]
MRARNMPLRAAAAGVLLLSGLSKRALNDEEANRLHALTVEAFPQLAPLEPESLVDLLARAEIALGSSLLIPLVPSGILGAGLVGFAAGLLRVYWTAPGLHQPGRLRPTDHWAPPSPRTSGWPPAPARR